MEKGVKIRGLGDIFIMVVFLMIFMVGHTGADVFLYHGGTYGRTRPSTHPTNLPVFVGEIFQMPPPMDFMDK